LAKSLRQSEFINRIFIITDKGGRGHEIAVGFGGGEVVVEFPEIFAD
jgi:hypothetical protein